MCECAWSRVEIIGLSLLCPFGCEACKPEVCGLRRECESIGGGYIKSGVWVDYRKFSAERRQNLGFADPSNLS